MDKSTAISNQKLLLNTLRSLGKTYNQSPDLLIIYLADINELAASELLLILWRMDIENLKLKRLDRSTAGT